jgi:hypothetical protein
MLGQVERPPRGGPRLNPAKASSAPPGIDQVKAAPDDSELLKRFVNDRSLCRDRVVAPRPKRPRSACGSRNCGEIEGIGTLPRRLANGIAKFAVVDAYGKRVELARVELSKLRDDLAAKPNQAELIHRYFDKLAMDARSPGPIRPPPATARRV